MVSIAWDSITHKVMNLKLSLWENKNNRIYSELAVNVRIGVVIISTVWYECFSHIYMRINYSLNLIHLALISAKLIRKKKKVRSKGEKFSRV